MITPNPHDTFIKPIFADREDAIAFFRSTLPKEVLEILDIDKLEQTKETFLPKNQNPTQTDILWKIKTKSGGEIYTYLLFEHKSYHDPKIYFQLLGYLNQIYLWQKNSTSELTPVIPFVFYHGEKNWDLGLKFSDQFKKTKELHKLFKYIPSFTIELFELNKTEVKTKFQPIALRVFLRLIQKIRVDREEFRPIFLNLLFELAQVETEAKKVEILEKLLHYLFSAREKDGKEFRDEKLYQAHGLGEEYMTVFDEVRLEGKVQGKLEGKLEDAEKMLNEKIDLSVILRVTGLSETDLREKGILQ